MASGRLERRYVSLHLAANLFHCRSRTASDMKCKLNITFLDESKISTKKNLARAKRSSGFREFAGESGSESTKIA